MSVECRITYTDPKPHIVREDEEQLLGVITVKPGNAIVVYNHNERGRHDLRLIQSDIEEARIYAVDPRAILSVISSDGSVSTRLIDREDNSIRFPQLRMVTIDSKLPTWEARILDEKGDFTGQIFTAKFV